jgi:Ca-activated chloride channel family protein
VAKIVSSILRQEAALIEDTPKRLMEDKPLKAALLVFVGLAGVMAFGGWRGHQPLPTRLRRGGLAVLALLIIWNPGWGHEKRSQLAADADVFILVDTSPSIAAEDWGDAQPRLEGIKADLKAIAQHHVGAHIGIITFNAEGRPTLPLTTNTGAVLSAADVLSPIVTYYASGSSVDAGLDLLQSTLVREEETHPERTRLVYYLGDGEQTSGHKVRSFADVKPLVDGGAVLGYGTEKGGAMLEHFPAYSDPSDLGEEEYIKAVDGSVGKSIIDEDNLRRIAEQMGVEYTHRSASEAVDGALWSGEVPERVVTNTVPAKRPLGPWLALAATPLVAWELVLLWERLRRARAAVRLGRRGQPVKPAVPGGSGGLGTAGGSASGSPGGESAGWLGVVQVGMAVNRH